MAGKRTERNGIDKPEPDQRRACRYTKKQLAGADYFRSRQDLVEALLDDGRGYTVGEAEAVISQFMKGKVDLC